MVPARCRRSASTPAPSSASTAFRPPTSTVCSPAARSGDALEGAAPSAPRHTTPPPPDADGAAPSRARSSRRSSTSTLPRLMADKEISTRALRELKELFDAGRPLVYLKSPEEERVQQLLSDASQQLFPKPVPVFTWTATEGLRGKDGAEVGKGTIEPRAALDWIV